MSLATSIYLATPCYGGLAHALYMQSLLALPAACAARGVGLEIDLNGGEALIGRGRSATMAKFLLSAASHLLFVDADIGFEPAGVFRLLDFGEDVVGGVYPRKTPPHASEVERLPHAETRERDGFATVASVGAGFLLISRAAAERLTAGYPELRAGFRDMPSVGLTDAVMVFDSAVDPETRHYLTDHQAFCHRWRALGGEVWADMRSCLRHVGAPED